MRNRLTNATARVAAFLTVGVMSLVGFGAAAWATDPPDPTGGAFSSNTTAAQTWMTTYGIPALLALALTGLVVGIALHYLRKSKSTATP